MDNLTFIFKSVGQIFLQVMTTECNVFGYTVTYGEAFIFAFFVSMFVWVLRELM